MGPFEAPKGTSTKGHLGQRSTLRLPELGCGQQAVRVAVAVLLPLQTRLRLLEDIALLEQLPRATPFVALRGGDGEGLRPVTLLALRCCGCRARNVLGCEFAARKVGDAEGLRPVPPVYNVGLRTRSASHGQFSKAHSGKTSPAPRRFELPKGILT